MTDFDLDVATLNTSFSPEFTREFYRTHTHVFALGPIRVNDFEGIHPYWSQNANGILSFDYLYEPRLVPILPHLRHIAFYSPLEMMQVNSRSLAAAGKTNSCKESESMLDALDIMLDCARTAHLSLSWFEMANLESVFLDLRIYSHDLNTARRCLSKFHIINAAKEMGHYLQLKTLMMAGLQSYSFFHVGDEDLSTARDIEEWDELEGEPNWIKIFRPAIREGSKIVHVDRLDDEN
jgi:hypothetical protein